MPTSQADAPRNLWTTALVTLLLSAPGGFLWIGRGKLAVIALIAILLAMAAVMAGAQHIYPWLSELRVPLYGTAWLVVTVLSLVAVLSFRNSSRPTAWYSNIVWVFILAWVPLFLIAQAVRTLLVQPFIVPSASMEPSLTVGDRFWVFKPAYGYGRFSGPVDIGIQGRLWGAPAERGDIVVFRHAASGTDYVMRVVGLPGETIRMIDGVLHIDGAPVDLVSQDPSGMDLETSGDVQRETLPNGASYLVVNARDGAIGDNTGPFEVPDGHYFVLGDNRDNAADSRFTTGFVPFEALIGRAEAVFWNDRGRPIAGREALVPDRPSMAVR